MRIDAEWTNDCSGKKDFDGPIVSISTRYWPANGGFYVLDKSGFNENQAEPGDKPSARACIVVNLSGGDSIEIVACDFEADTEEEVKSQVEKWADEKFKQVVSSVKSAFK